MAHLPAAGKPVPVSTYRVQLRPPADDHPGFGFDDADRRSVKTGEAIAVEARSVLVLRKVF